MKTASVIFLLCALCSLPVSALAQSHPKLILTREGVDTIHANLGKAPLFDATLQEVKAEVDAEIAQGIDTPIPKDFSGGYTHERHKRNFVIAQKAGVLFQILQDETYAEYIRDMLFQYEAMYQDLPLHPQERSYARGKLFWQCLNDSNWLVYMSQAYDTIRDWLSPAQREQLETNLFRPFADFISIGNPQFFNRVHNHSTWGNAAVGMIGLVMDDEELVQRALYGIEDDGSLAGLKDNDGGYIKLEGQRAGFFANLEEPFSPDGYYTEGPYYQRYAMYPFLIFSLALHNVKPELDIFEYKDGVLVKSVITLLNLSDADGEFFPLNDGQKGMSYQTSSLVTAVNIAYYYGDRDPQLLSVAEEQQRVLLDQSGMAVALGIKQGKAQPLLKSSVNLSDGANGEQGGVAILRAGDGPLELVFKYAAQGLSHGHYDKLSFSLYHRGDEVLQDYGLARFVNIEQKGGGNYLKENTTWAKQTVAHNTLVRDQVSHFEGSYDIGSQHHSELYFFDASRKDIQVVSATESNAYPGTEMHRTLAMINIDDFERPLLLDLMKVTSKERHQYDLPYYFMGQVIKTNFDYDSLAVLEPLGEADGYQHLYLEGRATSAPQNTVLSWLDKGSYYTLTTATQADDELLFTRIGANDPEFNLRREAALMLRRDNAGDSLFATAIEAHGSYSPVTELSINSNSNIAALKVVHDSEDYTAVTLETVNGKTYLFTLANKQADSDARHRLRIGKQRYKWKGPFDLIEL